MGAPWALLFHHHQGSGNRKISPLFSVIHIHIKPQTTNNGTFFFVFTAGPDGISARDSWETRGMRRSRLCVFFLSSLLAGGRGNRRSLREREREIFFCARKGGNLALVVFFRLGANDARAIFEEICVLWVFVRAKRVEFVRERRSDGRFLSAFTNRQKGGRGSRSRFFSFFSSSRVFHFSLTRKLFFLKKLTAITKDV